MGDGGTLVMNRLELVSPQVRKLCTSVSGVSGAPAIANRYVAFNGLGSFVSSGGAEVRQPSAVRGLVGISAGLQLCGQGGISKGAGRNSLPNRFLSLLRMSIDPAGCAFEAIASGRGARR